MFKIIMPTILLSLSKESKGRGGRGYADYESSPSVSSVGSSIFWSTKWDIELGDEAREVAVIDVNAMLWKDRLKRIDCLTSQSFEV